jgi:hypothetical protein
MNRFLIVVNQTAFIHTFPVLRKKLPVRSGFHCCMELLPADEAFHETRFLIYQFCYMFFLGHQPSISGGRVNIGTDPDRTLPEQHASRQKYNHFICGTAHHGGSGTHDKSALQAADVPSDG